jgi:hypothetical protein
MRITFPVPVILNRLATDFFVLTPLGRRIYQSFKKNGDYKPPSLPAQEFFYADFERAAPFMKSFPKRTFARLMFR